MMPSLISINNHTEGAPIYIGQDEEHALNINDEGLFDKINNATEVRTVIQDARCLTAITNDQLEISGVESAFRMISGIFRLLKTMFITLNPYINMTSER